MGNRGIISLGSIWTSSSSSQSGSVTREKQVHPLNGYLHGFPSRIVAVICGLGLLFLTRWTLLPRRAWAAVHGKVSDDSPQALVKACGTNKPWSDVCQISF